MKRILTMAMIMATMTVYGAAPVEPVDLLRQDTRELSKALADFSVSMVEQIATMRARLDLLERQVLDNRAAIRENTRFMDSSIGSGGVTKAAWNYWFVFLAALASSILTMVAGRLLTSKGRNSTGNNKG